jgi:hypothetical protein
LHSMVVDESSFCKGEDLGVQVHRLLSRRGVERNGVRNGDTLVLLGG